MKPRYKQFNPKRRLAAAALMSASDLEALALRVSYGKNPEHKSSPAGTLMPELRFEVEWLACGREPLLRETSGLLSIHAAEACLTRHHDTWSKTVRDGVLVSAYPLALWFAASWWRLNFEPLPALGNQPGVPWRMAHELAAADHGYVWPRVVFAPDGEAMTVWAQPSDNPSQSVSYLCGLDAPLSIPASRFQQSASGFIGEVIGRLRAVGHGETELSGLWQLVQEDMNDPPARAVRTLEAQLGFEPEECPAELIAQALALQEQTGQAAMAELAPVFGQRDGGASLAPVDELRGANGLRATPHLPGRGEWRAVPEGAAPWRQGVEAARQLRARMGREHQPLHDAQLLELLGLTRQQVEGWHPAGKPKVGIARPAIGGQVDFVPRKLHPLSRRFEFARLAGELLFSGKPTEGWLVESDLATARQKRQRAFAAEFLCPVKALAGLLDGDFSEAALEAAADHFAVSPQTVTSQLANNGYLASSEALMPYRLAYAAAPTPTP